MDYLLVDVILGRSLKWKRITCVQLKEVEKVNPDQVKPVCWPMTQISLP